MHISDFRDPSIHLELLQTVCEASSHGIFIIDSHAKLLTLNPSAMRVLGYDEADLLDKSIEDLLCREDLEREPILAEGLSRETVLIRNRRFICKDGSLLPLGLKIRLLPEGHQLWISENALDRKRTLEDAGSERDQLLEIFNSIDQVIYVSDPKTHEVLFVNAYLAKLLGRNPVGGRCYREFHGKDAPCEFCTNEILLQQKGKPYTWKYHNPVLNRDYLVTDRTIRWADDWNVRFELAIDITDLKIAEAELTKSEMKLRTLFQAVPTGLAIFLGNALWSINERFCEILGRSPDQLLDHDPRIFFADDEEFHRVGKGVLEQLKEKGSSHMETRFYRSDGTLRDIALYAAPLNPKDLSVGIALAIQDISDQKRQEEEKAKLQERLRQIDKMDSVGRLAGGIAHDFNNMLSVIQGNAEMALTGIDSAHPLYGPLQEIHQAALRSAGLTRQLLIFARKQSIDPKLLNLNETVSGMLKMLGRLIGEDIELIWKPGKDLWNIRMDPSQIDQLLANLCVNARDAISGVGRIIIETDNIVLDENILPEKIRHKKKEFVQLAVSDTGCGMDKGTIAQIFEPFFTTKASGKGTGLGLSTVYGVVNQNEGFINVYSEPGLGSTFKVFVPRDLANISKEAMVLQPETPSGRHETVLLVEDEPGMLRLSKTFLERLGYRVLAASSPSDAIGIAEAYDREIDLLMTDVIMPAMNGLDLSSVIQRLYPNIRVLFMSGYTDEVIAHRGLLKEGIHFLQKPFSRKDLAGKVLEALA